METSYSLKIKKIVSLILAALLLSQSVLCTRGTIRTYAQTGTVNTDRLNLRSGPGTSYRAVSVLSTNTKVTVNGTVSGNDGYHWYQVSLSNGTSGYIRSDFVNMEVIYGAQDASFEAYLDAQGFPESYKNALRGLHQKYPNWVFKAQHTGLDWNTAVANEAKIGRNLVETDSISSWKSVADGAFDWASNYWPGFDGANWVAASEEIIRHYMDPRNFLTDPYVFQFELQSYDPSVQTREGLAKMVEGTFLSGTVGQENTGSGTSSSGSYGATGPGGSTGPGSQSGSSSQNQSGQTGPVPGVMLVAPGQVSYGSSLFGTIVSYANWELRSDRWVYLNDDGTMKKSGWYWLDGNKDGIAECYYFYEDGFMAADTQIDGYTVNKDGAWVENGTVQVKYTNSSKSSGTGSGSATSSGSSVSTSTSAQTGSGTLYIDLIMQAASQSKVSPYVLAAMIIQEQGKNGTSPLISGTYSGYPGYYNFYNIAAYEHDGMTAVEAGLKYASESGNGQRPWNTVEKGIIGGAIAYGANYTDNGQDTFYLKKFNVQGSNKYNHQFMTNVVAAAQEGAKVGNAYSREIKNSSLIFKIPVYQNMPAEPCELPQGNGSPNNKLNTLYADGFQITPTFNMNVSEYSLIVDSSVEGITIHANAIDSSAKIQGSGYYTLANGTNTITVSVTAGNGTVRNYNLRITKQAGGAVYNDTAGGQNPTQNPTGPGGATGPGSSQNTASGPSSGSGATVTGESQTVSVPQETQSQTVPAQTASQNAMIIIGTPPM